MKAIRLFLVSAVCMVAFCCCAKRQTVSGTENGHDYVDLGLPSGTLWATCNVGANAPEEYGDYYAWGEIETKSDYWNTYKYYKPAIKMGAAYGYTKYCDSSKWGYKGFTDGKTVLDPEDDVAHVKWGGNWRIPTSDELQELLNRCTWTWIIQNGVNGYNVEGPNGNSIFLPAAGYFTFTELNLAGEIGDYWSNTLTSTSSECAYILSFVLDSYHFDGHNARWAGRSVRAVYSK